MSNKYTCPNLQTSIKRLNKLYSTLGECKPCNFNIQVIVGYKNKHLDIGNHDEAWEKILKEQKLHCGTAACVYGHFPVAFREYFKFGSDEQYVTKKNGEETEGYIEETADFLGITYEQSSYLTDPTNYPTGKEKGVKGRKEAMRRIQVLLQQQKDQLSIEKIRKTIGTLVDRRDALEGQIAQLNAKHYRELE